MTTNFHIFFVCTNFNNSEHTVRAARTFFAATGDRGRMIVVDNNSDAESTALLRELKCYGKKMEVLFLAENLGYFSGLNRGLAIARRTSSIDSVFVVGNNDIEFPLNLIDAFDKCYFLFKEYSVISPNIRTLDGVRQNPHLLAPVSRVRGMFYDMYYKNYWLGLLIKYCARKLSFFTKRADSKGWKSGREIFAGHGSCFILTPRFFEKFSHLDAPSFLYYEELFLQRQLHAAGEKIYYEPSIEILHHCHGSMNSLPSRSVWEFSSKAHQSYKDALLNQRSEGGRE